MRNYLAQLHRPVRSAVLALLAALAFGCLAPATAGGPDEEHRQEIESWHKQRAESLTSEDGWLTLVGLTWLEEGPNRLGSAPDSEVVVPSDKMPGAIATITVNGTEARIEIVPDVVVLHEGQSVESMNLATDAEGEPTVLELGDLTFYLIHRDGRLAVRMKDRNHPARDTFSGIETWPIDSSWRFHARLEPHDPPKTVPIPNVLGTVSQQSSPGAVVFEHQGQVYRIDALGEEGTDELFLIFADATTGRETYGGGRYLYAPVDADGEVDLDFNKAYNPPCAFTAYATCPLPPRQNRLSVRIEAGEKSYAGAH